MSLEKALLKLNIEEEFVKSFTCEECGKQIEQYNITIAIGPKKGEKTLVNKGCVCEEIKVIRRMIERHCNKELTQVRRFFEEHSFLNQTLNYSDFNNFDAYNDHLIEVKGKMEKFASDFKPDDGRSLLLHGSCGVGKSHLAVSCLKVIMQKGYEALFISVPKLLTKIKQTYNQDSPISEAELFNYIQKVELVVLDDIGAEYMNVKQGVDNWAQSKIFEVLDSRAGKTTIYTTNLSSRDLLAKLNERNFSRVMNQTEVVTVSAEDYRRREKRHV
ncbi:ATP-binding protein [Alkalibacillus silvisoli]|uniref:ATP-binding protein n=1 Tax=Alkalibacillus silvisoli TaxID=392823 RepID=A0ABP3JI07_9BACI